MSFWNLSFASESVNILAENLPVTLGRASYRVVCEFPGLRMPSWISETPCAYLEWHSPPPHSRAMQIRASRAKCLESCTCRHCRMENRPSTLANSAQIVFKPSHGAAPTDSAYPCFFSLATSYTPWEIHTFIWTTSNNWRNRYCLEVFLQHQAINGWLFCFSNIQSERNVITAFSLQLSREPKPFPKLIIKRKVDNIDDFKFDDFEVEGYEPHPKIAMQMAV